MLVCAFIYILYLCMRAAKALASLCICTDSPEHSLLDNTIMTKFSCVGCILQSRLKLAMPCDLDYFRETEDINFILKCPKDKVTF